MRVSACILYACVHAHTYIHMYIHVCMYIYTHTYEYVCTWLHPHMYIWAHECLCVLACICNLEKIKYNYIIFQSSRYGQFWIADNLINNSDTIKLWPLQTLIWRLQTLLLMHIYLCHQNFKGKSSIFDYLHVILWTAASICRAMDC